MRGLLAAALLGLLAASPGFSEGLLSPVPAAPRLPVASRSQVFIGGVSLCAEAEAYVGAALQTRAPLRVRATVVAFKSCRIPAAVTIGRVWLLSSDGEAEPALKVRLLPSGTPDRIQISAVFDSRIAETGKVGLSIEVTDAATGARAFLVSSALNVDTTY